MAQPLITLREKLKQKLDKFNEKRLLTLEQVYGAMPSASPSVYAFYLANKELVDGYLKAGEAEFEKLQQSCREKNPLLYQKLKTAQIQKQNQI